VAALSDTQTINLPGNSAIATRRSHVSNHKEWGQRLTAVVLAVLLTIVAALAGRVSAQETEPVVVAEGLNSPRHITFGPDGEVVIAEAGIGGTESGVGSFEEPVAYGLTSQVTVVAEGEASVLIPGLISRAYFGEGSYLGAHKTIITDESIWLLVGEGITPTPEGLPISALVQYDRESLEEVNFIDLYAFEAENNPDGDEQTIASNPVDFAVAEDGTIYIVDASANVVFTWTEADGLALFAVYPAAEAGSQVPTSVEIGPDGSVYIGFLGGFPFQREISASRIEQLSPEGEVIATFDGTNLVTDLAFDDAGNLYAVELADGFGDAGYLPDSGRVIMVTEDGLTPVAAGLNFPYGIAFSPEGELLVSVNSSFVGEGEGQVIAVEMMISNMTETETPEEPAATEEGG
jgi:hypothetical protein